MVGTACLATGPVPNWSASVAGPPWLRYSRRISASWFGIERHRLGRMLRHARAAGLIDQHALGVFDLQRQLDGAVALRVEGVRRIALRQAGGRSNAR